MGVTTCGHEPFLAKGMCRKCYNAEYTKATKEKRAAKYQAERQQRREANRAYRAANKDRLNAYLREWRRANPGYSTRYKYANLERIKARDAARAEEIAAVSQRWAVANRDRKRTAANRRRARATEGADLTPGQWSAILADFGGFCAYCGTEAPLVMEHMTPLVRGGRHTASNVVPACAPCNARKFTKTAFEFGGYEPTPRTALREAC